MARRRRESIRRKARRLSITKGSIQITRAGFDFVEAIVKGYTDTYLVRIKPGYRNCSCAAIGECSHILAVKNYWVPIDGAEIEELEGKFKAVKP